MVENTKRLGLMPYFATLVQLSTQDHTSATLDQGDTGRPGIAEQMLADVGLELVHRSSATVVNEWPDLGVAILALCAAGPSLSGHAGAR